MRSGMRFRLRKSPKTIDLAVRLLTRKAGLFVPYYRELFASSALQPHSIDHAEALAMLPITPRRRLSELPYRHFVHEKARLNRLYVSHTSGGTGTPATMFLSRMEVYYRRFLLLRATRSRFPECLPTRVADVGQVISRNVPRNPQRFGPIRVTRIPGTLPMPEQVRLYTESAPQLLEGYAGCLELLGEELSTTRRYPRPRWLISRGEALTPPARAFLEKVFGCPVANFYNSEEVGNMAWECPHRTGTLHVNTDACIIELLDEHGDAVPQGEEGRVVLTNLYNHTMPFIRYDIGDHATWDDPDPHPCTCGANTPTLASIDGRTDDFLFLPDSRRVSPLVVLTAVLYGFSHTTPEGTHVPQVRQFQVVQDKMGEAEIRVVLRRSMPPDAVERIQAKFEELHPKFRTRVSVVEAIPLEQSGKLKRIICHVAPPCTPPW
ncbi:phenylacetate--CoA ligase family protein [Candidatus Bipolaricaulota bacterium]